MLSRLSSLGATLVVSGVLLAASGGDAQAQAVGDPIINPVTGAVLAVTAVVPNGVLATGNVFILTSTAVGTVLPDPTNPAATVTIASRVINATTHLVESVTFVGGRTLNVLVPVTAPSPGVVGTTPVITLAAGAGDANNLAFISPGRTGDGGHDGALFVSPASGDPGAPGPSVIETVAASRPNITTVTPGLPGIIAVSIGGNGGAGGDGYLGPAGAQGGAGGAGGTVNLTSHVAQISTTGNLAHGIVAQSRSGRGGLGGDGILAVGGGAGGAGNDGGSATATSYGAITTRGNGAIGVFAQSLGGGAGDGGGSYGLFGNAGDGDVGGNGGRAEAINYGTVSTLGNYAYGVSAQSIGGIGGNAGDSVALVAFTSTGAPGGNGGTAIARAQAGSSIRTEGLAAYGLFAQSIGGGGGNGGLSVGLVALGSDGAAGGNGGLVQVFTQAGAAITTTNSFSHAIFAQSVGGGGGNGGLTSGAFAMGGDGSGGGIGGTVFVDSGATIRTGGLDARGIFAQSVGGGGGSAFGTGGIVSLGGNGGAGGGSGTVTINTTTGSMITTTQRGGDGIFAQSVGGGGGSGSTSGGVVALGGDGGLGGAGNTVLVTNYGTISTAGHFARGIFAQSVGGGGGSGGDSGGLVALGGNGAAASAGGNVTVNNYGIITTALNIASAIQAQSIGGGGGDGGTTGGVFLTIGGNAGGGGDAGVVTVNNYNNLTTGGNDAHGIFAQSVGGGGGNGGASVSVSAFAGVAIGGDGEAGGAGGQVDVNLFNRTVDIGGVPTSVLASIETSGDRSRGIYAQSVGGGGGSGGFASQTSVGFGGAISIAIGGSGAGGGAGGAVNVFGDVAINTTGRFSEGILAQSVGGGGGAGGFAVAVAFAASPGPAASLSVGIGGSGAGGGAGGLVTLDAGGSIVTDGQFSTGLLAQSVGGGGGNGGFSVSASIAGAPIASLAIGVGIGGSAGAGGLGGVVDATFNGTIRTVEDDSHGAVIQSVGGGGGNGGFNVSGAVGLGGVAGGAVAVGVGGSGGAGGQGGTATGHIGNTVDTTGDRSTGVIIQSVGGGGGSGGFNISGSIGGGGVVGGAVSVGVGGSGDTGGAGGTVNAFASSIITRGDQSGGFLAQSVGGGGGSGAMNISGNIAAAGVGSVGISVGVGGAGGGGGAGGRVTAQVNGNVSTNGVDSDAIVAQSIGGGGGSGGLNVSAGLSASGGVSGAIGVGVGGSGGTGSDSDNADLVVTGTTWTTGLNSDGILVQSVGGGGGGGGVNVTGNVALSTTAAGTIGVGVGGSGGGGGNARSASLRLNEGVADLDNTLLAVSTTGDNANAIVVQSVGGGGGTGAVNVTGSLAFSSTAAANIGVGVGGFGGDGGNSGFSPTDVVAYASVNGDVVTTGDRSSAIFVQSLGGGGGNGGVNVTAGISGSTSLSGNLMVGVGGFGGDGGDAAAVAGTVRSDIRTGTITSAGSTEIVTGHGSSGVTFQSLGGGGGNGALNVSGGLSIGGGATGTLAVGIGGFAGGGGNASTVDATFNGSIQTLGNQAHGLLLQSLGGGGGNGGINITGAVSLAGGASGAVGFGLGGFGGDGGYSSQVTGHLTGDVLTHGDDSFGAVLQSLGGGGGNGALNVTGTLAATVGGSGSGSLGIGIGGFGGDGGASGSVYGTVIGDYTTYGVNARGVLAQSQAGGGGNGGLNVSAAVQLGLGSGAAGSVGIGGFGGDGASTAGEVVLIRSGDTVTRGAGSDGVTAQSLGGGGGNGGINISAGVSATLNSGASLGFGLGGFGGDGGDSGLVTANIQGNVIARGLASDVTVNDIFVPINLGPIFSGGLTETGFVIPGTGRQRLGGSNGVVVQSQGGGGGIGGLNVTGQLAIGGDSGRAVALGIGGFGGGGGDAGAVDLTLGSLANHVQVQGVGDERSAVIVQSVGGGGGVGGINVSGGISTNGNLIAGIGGFGGDGGLGRAVTANINADLFASGNLSRGLLAQSVGGGGGYGGINVSAGINAAGSVNVGNDSSLVFGLGGFGGAGNRSGNVTVTHNGQVSVEGEGSVGLLVQSIAGGGGSGGLNVSGNLALGGSDGFGVAIGIGGSGGTGADAGTVSLTSSGNIYARTSTVIEAGASELDSRRRATSTAGIIAQSIGGGGGQGGVNVTGAIARNGSPIAVGVGGSGGSGGDGNTVTVVRGYIDNGAGLTAAPGLIRTYGNEGIGLLAQSVGGGGGNAGVNLVLAGTLAGDDNPVSAIIAVGGSGAGAGSGKTVAVVHMGDIVTDGQASGGLLAQSLGGGGGNAAFNVGLGYVKGASALNLAVGGGTGAAGSGGLVAVAHDGTIITAGDDSAGLTAQSIGGGGGNTALNMAMGLGSSRGLNIGIGREGGTGGTGGNVLIAADGFIDTTGDRSSGIVGQSIGGGGGISGSTSVGVSSTSGTGTSERSFQGSVAVGLTGGTGATSGTVNITSSATVVTRGDASHAIHAQSTGGGGGVGGSAMNTLIRQSGSFTVGVGGDGGTGNDSGVVTVVSDGILVTGGDASDGIFAQSIGGGGGQGGYSALLALQLGGAASNGSSNLAVNVGGSGGNGSSGQAVNVTNRGTISTTGERSFGIRAQSIGGGGGDGGMAIGFRAQGSGDNMSAEFRVGGSGNSGGAGRNVDVLNEGLIVTTGRESAGISANSIGGGGGNGGLVVDAVGGAAGAGNTTGRFIVNIGGSGGTGGTSGNVTVTNRTTAAADSGTILTTGEGAYGILAQSLSGGGGNGSSVISLTAMSSGSDSATFGLNIGGAGGAANQAGTVTVNNGGIIETTGLGAHGILAQSIGGGGGNGGLSLAGSLLIGAATNTPLISVGGAGGDGGNANTVTVNNTGNILTRGALAHGIVAQSIGGGGGNANMGISASGNAYTAIGSNALSAIVGAVSSGNGGLGGAVTVNHSGDITVLGAGSKAIVAQSINGGGGSLTFDFDGITSAPGRPFGPPGGGVAADPLVSARLGGVLASNMSSDALFIHSTGTFGAGGDNGAGAMAQSIGGGGGTADILLTLGVEAPVPAPLAGGLGAPAPGPVAIGAGAPVDLRTILGGVDGLNNHGAAVTTTHSGDTLTTGINSPGVLVQSIGGGGGRSNVTVVAPTGSVLGTVNLALGETNGTNETGGDIDRVQTGQVVTTGDLSTGTVLQSIGGGGGTVGATLSGAGTGDTVVYTAVGAAGGTVLEGGTLSGTLSGGIVTQGDSSVGLMAQSIGAGGGDVRVLGGQALDVTLGAGAGASGSGGAVSLTNSGIIQTGGDRSHGVLLQSIGGGGGVVLSATGVSSLTLSNQNSGDGGTVSFTQTGSIVTGGSDTFGLIAQSLGGGGGWVDGTFAGTAGGAGRGGAINLSVSGDIYAAEAGSTGVLAQSLGRDGAGDITTFVTGAVRGGSGSGIGVSYDGGLNNRLVTSGSVSAVSGLAINATFGNDAVSNTGLVVGNIDLGAGSNAFNNETGATFIAFNTIDLRDSVAPPAPLAPTTKGAAAQVIPSMAAVIDGPQVLPVPTGSAKGTDQPQVIPGQDAGAKGSNQPQVIPGQDATTKVGTEPQVPPALFAGPGPDLLAAPLPDLTATFANAGNFVMGLSAPRYPLDLANGDVFGNLDDDGPPQTNLLYGARVINTVELDGHYLQTADGNLVFDVAYGPYASDVVNVSGNTTVDGTGQVILTWLENSNPYTLFATAGTAVDNGLEIDDTLAIDFGIIANDIGIQLTIATDFGLPFLNANEQALGGHMDSAISVGDSGGIGRLMTLIGNLRVGEEATYAAIFDQLNPEPHVAPTYRQLVAAEDFSQQLFSCPGRVSRLEDNCAWARVETASTDRIGNVENYDVEGQTMQFRGGFEHRLDARWSLAGAVGYDRLDRMHVDGDRAHTEGDGVHAGLGVRHAGPAGGDIGVSLSGGWQWLETERQLNVFQPGVGTSSPETGYAQIEAHAARVFTHDALFLRPALTATYTALHHAGLTETGLDGLGVEVLEETQYIGSITPELSIGATMQDDERGYAAATFTVGQVFRTDDQLVLPMRLLGANPAADPALIATALDRQALRLGAELRVARASGLEVRVGYTAELSDDVHNHTAGISLKMPF